MCCTSLDDVISYFFIDLMYSFLLSMTLLFILLMYGMCTRYIIHSRIWFLLGCVWFGYLMCLSFCCTLNTVLMCFLSKLQIWSIVSFMLVGLFFSDFHCFLCLMCVVYFLEHFRDLCLCETVKLFCWSVYTNVSEKLFCWSLLSFVVIC